MAEDQKQPLNIIYLVPENACEFITQGKPYCFQDGHLRSYDYKYGQGQIVYIQLIDHSRETIDFKCSFNARNGQILQPGIYKNASRRRCFNGEVPGLDVSGFSRGCNECSGEFEIF